MSIILQKNTHKRTLYRKKFNRYGLLGSSGCGKTTILGCILGRKSFQKGEINLFGEKVKSVPSKKVGYMPQVKNIYLF